MNDNDAPKATFRLDTTTWLCGPPPANGQKQRYPGRFWFNFKRTYPLEGKRVLHMFAGSVDFGDTTDIRPETGAAIVAPYDALPIPDSSYDMVIADPPYTMGFANQWLTHPKDSPRPKRILKEAARIVKAGGRIFILHVIIIPAYNGFGVRRIALHPVLTGPNNAIRVLNVFEKVVNES